MRLTALSLALGLVVACGGAGVEATTTEVPTTEVSSTTTTTEATTTTTQAVTTTIRATTTTEELTVESVVAIWALTFEAFRQDLIDIWNEDINVESVDGLVIETDEPGNLDTVYAVLDVTSGWASEDNQHDGAWEITRIMAPFWHPLDGPWYNEQWQPGFRLVNSGRVYECPAEFMVRLADARASRTEWEEVCA